MNNNARQQTTMVIWGPWDGWLMLASDLLNMVSSNVAIPESGTIRSKANTPAMSQCLSRSDLVFYWLGNFDRVRAKMRENLDEWESPHTSLRAEVCWVHKSSMRTRKRTLVQKQLIWVQTNCSKREHNKFARDQGLFEREEAGFWGKTLQKSREIKKKCSQNKRLLRWIKIGKKCHMFNATPLYLIKYKTVVAKYFYNMMTIILTFGAVVDSVDHYSHRAEPQSWIGDQLSKYTT